MSEPYIPLQLIDAGAASEVFVARPAGGEGRVALRHLRGDTRRDTRLAREWLEIGRALRPMDHPGLVRVLDAGAGEEPWIATELLAGENLRWINRRMIGRGERAPVALAVHVARAVADALAYLHEGRGGAALIHRAVVPGKIFLCDDGAVKLLAPAPTPTLSGSTLAADEGQQERRRFTSPEAAQGAPATPGSDLWQLGVCLHELLTGKPLFTGRTDLEVLREVLGGDVPTLAAGREDAPAPLVDVIARLLTRDAAARYPDARALAHDLERVGVPEREGREAVLAAFADEDELDDAEVTALHARPAAPPTVELAPPSPAAAWEERSDVFGEELSDHFDLRTNLMPAPTFAAPPAARVDGPSTPDTVTTGERPGVAARGQDAPAQVPAAPAQRPEPPTPRPMSPPPTAAFTAIGPAPEEAPPIPERVGGFRVERPIDPVEPWARYVVVDDDGRKLVVWERELDASSAAERDRQLDTLASLDTPLIAQPTARGYDEGRYFVGYRRIPGAALETLMRGTGDQPAALCVLVLRDVLGALALAHGAGLVHGSVRPRTVRLSADGRAVVHGLGLGFDAPVSDEDALRRCAYASPEQCGGRRGTPASDLYQCGALLHEMLTGVPPFVRATAPETRAAILGARPSSLLAHAFGVPWTLADLHLRLLAPAPADRYASVDEALVDLGPLLDTVTAATSGGLARYLKGPAAAHTRLSQQHATAEVHVARELLEETPPRHPAAALAFLRAAHLDPANDEAAALLRRTLARAGFSADDGHLDPRLRELEDELARSPDDTRLLAALVQTARRERRLPELARYLHEYARAAPDDADAQRALLALRPSHPGAPFASLLRDAARKTRPRQPAPPTHAAPPPSRNVGVARDAPAGGDRLPWVMAGIAALLALLALLFFLADR